MSIDPHLATSVHLTWLRRAEADADPAAAHTIFQVSSMEALLARAYEGDCTIGEVRAHGDFGLGTTQQVDGELIALDGEVWCARDEGRLDPIADDELTPFAVVVPFSPTVTAPLAACASFDELAARLDELPGASECAAVRIDGRFPRLSLRCALRQQPPYPSLADIAEHAARFALDDAEGTLVGFRFPAALEGVEMPGFHLHFIAADRSRGGHVLDLAIAEGAQARLDVSSAVHLEVPAELPLPRAHPDEAARALLHRIERE
jgi:acetolactate decarboxylase